MDIIDFILRFLGLKNSETSPITSCSFINMESPGEFKNINVETEIPLDLIRYEKDDVILEATCPKCGKTNVLREFSKVDGPVYSKVDVGKGVFRPMIRIHTIQTCTKCGHVKSKKIIMIPLDTSDALSVFMNRELKETIELIRARSQRIENVLKKFIV